MDYLIQPHLRKLVFLFPLEGQNWGFVRYLRLEFFYYMYLKSAFDTISWCMESGIFRWSFTLFHCPGCLQVSIDLAVRESCSQVGNDWSGFVLVERLSFSYEGLIANVKNRCLPPLFCLFVYSISNSDFCFISLQSMEVELCTYNINVLTVQFLYR